MKHLFLTIVSLIFLTSCNAQIASLYNADPDLPNGTYYKDLDGDLNKFVGTWLWQNGTSELVIEIQKKEEVADSDNSHFNDMLVGEYKYIENGVEIMDYLNRFNDTSISGRDHYLTLQSIMHKNHRPICDVCDATERRVKMFVYDPLVSYIPAKVTLRHVIENGIEKLEAYLYAGDAWAQPSENDPNWIRIPEGNYVLIKQ